MMVMGYEFMYMAILVLQRGLYVIKVDRNDDFIKQLREAEISFWKDYVEQDKMPEPDGSEASLDTLNVIFPEEHKDTEITIFGLDQMVKDYKAYKQLKDEYHQKAERIKAMICAKIGDAEVGKGRNVSCSWKTQSRENISPKKLKASYPDIYKKLVDTTKYRVFRVKTIGDKEK